MAQPFLGEIILFAGNFAPQNYMRCDGQILNTAQNAALFGLIGMLYGSVVKKGTFKLPDLRGRVAIGQGHAPNLANYSVGQSGGTETVTLTTQQIPIHNHAAAATDVGNASKPGSSTVLANETLVPQTGAFSYAPFNAGSQVTLAPNSVASSGKAMPHPNVQPVLTLGYCIAVAGAVPTQ